MCICAACYCKNESTAVVTTIDCGVQGHTALTIAASCGHEAAVDYLLSMHVDVNKQDEVGGYVIA
jgi:ankyrin repeat protein